MEALITHVHYLLFVKRGNFLSFSTLTELRLNKYSLNREAGRSLILLYL